MLDPKHFNVTFWLRIIDKIQGRATTGFIVRRMNAGCEQKGGCCGAGVLTEGHTQTHSRTHPHALTLTVTITFTATRTLTLALAFTLTFTFTRALQITITCTPSTDAQGDTNS